MTTTETTFAELQIKSAGMDRSIIMVHELSDIVRQNWKVIFLGACRMGVAIDSNYYAPERVQIGETRLHKNMGVKYANGWKYDGLVGPSDENIKATVTAIQSLIDAGAEHVGTNLRLEVRND